MNFEGPRQTTREESIEIEEEIESFYADPKIKSLLEMSVNAAKIKSCSTPREVLDYIHDLLKRREIATQLKVIDLPIDNLDTIVEANPEGIKFLMQSLKEHQMLIGEGGDAWFVVHRDEIFNGRAVVGYKIFKQEKRRRGRNSPRLEHDIQLQAFEVLNKSNLLFKVPQPFGYAELTEDKLISMENLNALSVDDLQRGRGALPNWLREPGMIDQFCEELKKALDLLHSQNIFHRDMHPGNVMVSLKRENNISPFGYIIDFGLSGAEFDEQYAYKKEVAGQVFTFKDDYAIIQQVSNILKRLWRKEHASKSNDAGTDPANPSGAPL